jgi:peptidoglycan/LPS O-acetylase OafA/YrhL
LTVNPLARLFEFTLGMVACLAMLEFRSGQKKSPISATCLEMLALLMIAGALAVCPQLFSLTRQHPPPFVYATAFWLSFCGGAFGYALLIFSLSLEEGMFARLLKAPYLVKLGEISYSMYLLHYPIMLWFQYYLLPAPLTQTSFKCLSYCSMLIASSMMVYRFIEVPARAFIRRRSERFLLSKTIAQLSRYLIFPDRKLDLLKP